MPYNFRCALIICDIYRHVVGRAMLGVVPWAAMCGNRATLTMLKME